MPPSVARSGFRLVSEWYGHLLSILLALTVAVIIVPVTLQIVSRYTPLIPSYIWTEELARFMLVWMVMLGAMLGVREASHFTVDVFPRLPVRGEAVMDLVSGVFVLVLAVVFLWWGWEFTEFAIYRISELAELPLWTIHVAWPITGFTWLLFMGERMVDSARTLRDGVPRTRRGLGLESAT